MPDGLKVESYGLLPPHNENPNVDIPLIELLVAPPRAVPKCPDAIFKSTELSDFPTNYNNVETFIVASSLPDRYVAL